MVAVASTVWPVPWRGRDWNQETHCLRQAWAGGADGSWLSPEPRRVSLGTA